MEQTSVFSIVVVQYRYSKVVIHRYLLRDWANWLVSILLFSGRELFLADASLFIDDAEAYEIYNRQEGRDQADKQEVVIFSFCYMSNASVFILRESRILVRLSYWLR